MRKRRPARSGAVPPQTRRRCRRAVAPLPRPSLLARPLTSLEGVGPAAARHAAKLGIETRRRPARAPAVRPSRLRATRAPVAELAIGEEATVAVTVKRLPRAAHPPPAADDPRMPGRRRHRAAEGGLVQPGLPRRPAHARGAPAAARASSRAAAAAPTFRVSEHEIERGGRRRARAATRPASCRSTRPPRGSRRAASASWRSRLRGLRGARARAAAARGCAPARALAGQGGRARGRALARVARRGARSRAAGSRSRSCSCSSSRS